MIDFNLRFVNEDFQIITSQTGEIDNITTLLNKSISRHNFKFLWDGRFVRYVKILEGVISNKCQVLILG